MRPKGRQSQASGDYVEGKRTLKSSGKKGNPNNWFHTLKRERENVGAGPRQLARRRRQGRRCSEKRRPRASGTRPGRGEAQ